MRSLLAGFEGPDILAVAGLALMTLGIALRDVPAALITLGTILFLLAVAPYVLPRRDGG